MTAATEAIVARMCDGFAPTSVQMGDLPAVLEAGPVAGLVGVSKWALYDAVKRGDFPIQPIRVGRRLKFRTTEVLTLIGVSTPSCVASS